MHQSKVKSHQVSFPRCLYCMYIHNWTIWKEKGDNARERVDGQKSFGDSHERRLFVQRNEGRSYIHNRLLSDKRDLFKQFSYIRENVFRKKNVIRLADERKFCWRLHQPIVRKQLGAYTPHSSICSGTPVYIHLINNPPGVPLPRVYVHLTSGVFNYSGVSTPPPHLSSSSYVF